MEAQMEGRFPDKRRTRRWRLGRLETALPQTGFCRSLGAQSAATAVPDSVRAFNMERMERLSRCVDEGADSTLTKRGTWCKLY